MPSRDLPARPHLDHLKHEAKALQRAFHAGDAAAVARVRAVVGEPREVRLTDAQRVIAREYGFPSWARLRAQVESIRAAEDPVRAFLDAVQAQDARRAKRILAAHPRIPADDLHVAATLGSRDDVRRLLAADPSRVDARAGEPPATPLLYLG